MSIRCGPTLYLVKRGPRPEYHRATFHPVIVTDRKPIAEWEAGWTGDGATVWHHQSSDRCTGWLIVRWCGFDIDYGHIVRSFALPDGTIAAFRHTKDNEPWTLIAGAVWWSLAPMPAWLRNLGCIEAPDEFTQVRIRDGWKFHYRDVQAKPARSRTRESGTGATGPGASTTAESVPSENTKKAGLGGQG